MHLHYQLHSVLSFQQQSQLPASHAQNAPQCIQMQSLRNFGTGSMCKQCWPAKCHPIVPGSRPSTLRKGLTRHATGTGREGQVTEQQVAASATQEDPFTIASMRLRHLLSEASWDTNEAVRAELSTYTPAMKLTFLTNCSSFATLVAIAISWITGEDPLGGVTLTSDTVHAAGVGLLAALPLVVASMMLRTQPAKQAVPLVADLHATQATLLQPLLKDLNLPQLLIASSFTVMPVLLLLFPTMHGVATMALAMAEPDLVVQPVTAAMSTAQDTVASNPAGDDFILQHMLRYDLFTDDISPTGSGFTAVGGESWDAWKAAGLDQLDDATGQVAVDAADQLAATGAAAADAVNSAETEAAGGWEAAVAWAWAMHSSPLSPPMLLPQGVPDFVEILEDQVDELFDPSTSRLMRNVGLEATSLAPAILSGFLAAYTVMRQLAPRGSQVRAIRDALTASDRYFRLHMSMSRLTNRSAKALTPSGSAAPGDADNAPSSSSEGSLRERLQNMPSSSSAFTRAANDMLMSGSTAAMGASAGGSVAVSGPTDATSMAVSDAFRKVAVMWLLTRRKVCQLAYMLTAFNILYFALLWQETGNLATPATTAVICVMVEMWCCQQEPEPGV